MAKINLNSGEYCPNNSIARKLGRLNSIRIINSSLESLVIVAGGPVAFGLKPLMS